MSHHQNHVYQENGKGEPACLTSDPRRPSLHPQENKKLKPETLDPDPITEA